VTLSPLAERFAEVLVTDHRSRVRIGIEEVELLFRRAVPELATAPDRRHRLADVLAELAGAGLVRTAARARDRREHPWLPTYVVPVRDAPPPRIAPEAAAFGWRPELAWAHALPLSPQEFAFLRRVQEFLKAGGRERPIVPLAERSLRLTANEKALDGRGRLFGPGRLSLDLLRAERASPPFVYRTVGAGPVALVVENAATYRSVLRTLPADSPVGLVAFGSGQGFTGSVAFFADLRDEGVAPSEIRYFGDLDRRGLDIPADASLVARELGLPAVRPAVGLYARLLRAGVRRAADPIDEDTADELVAWLPATLAPAARRLLVGGVAIAQENIGTEALGADPSWASWAGLGPPGGGDADRSVVTAPTVVRRAPVLAPAYGFDGPGPAREGAGWVAASRTRSWLLGDPILDWLRLHGRTAGFFPDDERAGYDARTDFRRFVLEQGRRFENAVMRLLAERMPITQIAAGWADSRSRGCAMATLDAMRAGAPVIAQGVLHDDELLVFGMPDLLVRSDVLAGLFPEVVPLDDVELAAPVLESRFHYRVVDIKLRTFGILRDGHASEAADSLPFAVQVWLYNRALGRTQGFEPRSAYLLGRTWTTSDGERGEGCLERLARVDADRWIGERGASLEDLALDAVAWVRRVRADGASWRALPEPSVPELYPHMRNGEDSPWHLAKAEIAAAIRELTLLPRMNPTRRRLAHDAGIRRWDDPRASAETIGIVGPDGIAQVTAILAANRSPVPTVIPTALSPGGAWRATAPVEVFVDFETVSNLADDFAGLPAVGGWAGIFQIGCGWLDAASGEWRFAQWTADRLDDPSERTIVDAWLRHLGSLCSAAGVDLGDARVVHWSAAEGSALDTAYNATRTRHSEAAWPEVPWFDLLDIVRDVPVGVTGAFVYGLKAIAKGMAAQGLIATTWGDGTTDGLGAMVGAWWCDAEARRTGVPMSDLPLTRQIGAYNEVDCRVMAEILVWLRANR
jgi:hypothetical protein